MITAELREKLHKTVLFREFTDQEMSEFLDLLDPLSAKPGEIVVRQDEVGDCMYIVVAGSCRVVHHKGGREVELAVMHEGDFFGELALVDEGPRSADVIAISDVAMLKISQAVIAAVAGVIRPQPSSCSSQSAGSWSNVCASRTNVTSTACSSRLGGRLAPVPARRWINSSLHLLPTAITPTRDLTQHHWWPC